ncbi:MAG: hypothetical protein B9S32_15000 [Verrucomicrobia bacterium Tous-C9LFEB]|nr:MAG: hypothetical protein B9S32_15000 [Verrucomicrobia bacterium Tous-C9LFEB]
MPETSASIECSPAKSERELRYEQFAEAISCSNLDDFYRVVLDSIPSPLLIVEKDVIIVDYNVSANSLISEQREAALKQRFGQAIHCLHSHDVPAGCGRGPDCGQCLIRNAVNHALNGTAITRQKLELELVETDKTRKAVYWLTTTPLTYGQRTYALLLLDQAESPP